MNVRSRISHGLSPVLIATVLSSILHLTSAAQPTQPASSGDGSCRYDRAKMLALDYQAFDQTPNQGWREFTAGDKCLIEGADLIRDYRAGKNLPHPMLYWHEGQLRALNGSVTEAVQLMELSRPFSASVSGWSEYVDATIAFLRKDRTAYDKARAALAAIPQAPLLGAVDQLGQCFSKPYIQAYRSCEK